MLPITRANLQSFCRNCLREFTPKEITHDIEQSAIQRNRLFPQKVCHCCYIKIKTLKGFQDRANLATGVLKLIVEERFIDKSDKTEIETLERRLKLFCRLCLKSNAKSSENCLDAQIFNDIKDCTGLQIERISIKLEGTDDPLSDDERYSHSICARCQTTLKGFIEYRKVAKQTIDYLQSILDDDDDEDTSRYIPFAAEEGTPKKSSEIESVELPCSRFDSKFVEKELNEQLTQQEDVLSIDSMSEESIFSDKFTQQQNDATSKGVARTRRHNRKQTKSQNCQIENVRRKRKPREVNEELHKMYENYNQLEEHTFSKLNEELREEQKPQNEIELNEQLQTYKETNIEIETHKPQPIEILFKSENAANLIKNEFTGNEEDFISVDRNCFDDNINPVDVNPIAFSNITNANNVPQESQQAESVKQETDSDSDVNYQPDHVGLDSDTNSDDICLAKLASQYPKTRTKAKIKTRIKASVKNEQKAKFTCDKCNKSFFKKHTIEAHLKSHEGASKVFACKQCESSFTTYQALQRHTNNHDGKGTTLRSKRQQIAMRYKSTRECPKCHLVLKRHIDLADHIRRTHNGVYVFKCKLCGKCLSTQAALNRHEQNHSNERPFACKYCEKRYNYETELKVHMQRHTADPALLCPICKTARPNPEELQRHIASHKKPHQCSKCGKVFTKAYSLHQHDLSVHLNLKVHKCPQCDLSFKGRKTLTLHRLHHDPTGRPETCRVCGLHFRTKRGRLRHTSKFHPNAELPPEEPSPTAVDDGRNECCEKCPLRFKTKRGLMLHTKKTHEKGKRVSKTEDELKEKYGDRSEVCELCQLQCYSKKGLSRHIRKSHPDLAVAKDQEKSAFCSEACILCPLKFRTARGLLLHTKRMHRDNAISQETKHIAPTDIEEQKLSLPLNWI